VIELPWSTDHEEMSGTRFELRLALRSVALCAAAIAAAATPAWAESSFEELAKEIVRLRGTIDELSVRLEDEKEAQRNQLRSLAQQKLALEADLQREGQRRDQLVREVGRIDDRGKKDEARTVGMRGVVEQAIQRIQPAIYAGVPFRRDERRAALESIRLELEDGRSSAPVALAKLWTFAESELTLTRSLSVESQIVSVDGQEMLADVARAGTVLLYFRTPDGRFGAARSTEGAWRWTVVTTPDEIQQVSALFLALEGRQRAGFFVLPGALAAVVKNSETK